ncbi:MAG: Trm112 family protein [bacterium]|nr:Trm112 family protein [bacterium]
MRKSFFKGDKMEKEIISKDLLDILACPLCKTEVELLEYKKGKHGLKCAECKKIYPIKDGIPVMLVDEAVPVS